MLSEKYQNIYNAVKEEIDFSEDILMRCFEEIDGFSVNEYVYTEYLVDSFQISENSALRLQAILTREKILKKVYKLYCPECHSFDSGTYNSPSEVSKIEECSKCSFVYVTKDNPFKYLVILFKKNQ